jgi:hypothetical protein
MNKLIIQRVLILLAIGLVIVVVYRGRMPFGSNNSFFAVEPQKEISKIELSEKGRELSLEKVGENWVINGKLETRKSGILFILRILEEMKIKSPVSSELFESEITAKGIEPVRIRVYEKRKLIKSFLVYKTTSNSYGNIMKMSERSKPFIVCVPGYEGNIGSGFTLNELFWKPYTLFNLLPSEIEYINFENLSDTSSSFSISNENHHFTLRSMNRDLEGWDSTLVTRYLSYFAWIPFEKWALDLREEEKKNVESQKPLYRITVNTKYGKKTVLALWEKMSGEGGGSGTKDSDRLLGKTEASDEFFVLRYFDMDPLLKKRSYFFPE